jgi:hypothetical protein
LSHKFASPNRSKRQLLTVAALRAAALSFSGVPFHSQSAVETDFSFALIGDTPYTTLDELSGAKVIQEASTGASFTIHVGDIKNGVAPCTDELLTRRIKFLDASPIPLIYLPGDNEWIDCRFSEEAPFDPINRLQFVRKLAFSNSKSLGVKKIDTQFQAEFPEHRQWNHGGVQFVSLNVAGSYNGVGILPQASIDARMQAVRTWLELSVSQAIQNKQRGLVVALHANIGINRNGFYNLSGKRATAFGDFRQFLLDQFKRWDKPCLLLHGDSHVFANDKPSPAHPLLQRVDVVHQNPALFVVSANHL